MDLFADSFNKKSWESFYGPDTGHVSSHESFMMVSTMQYSEWLDLDFFLYPEEKIGDEAFPTWTTWIENPHKQTFTRQNNMTSKIFFAYYIVLINHVVKLMHQID